MDTNYLLRREQISLMMAGKATSAEARLAHAGLARAYGALLAASRFPHRQFKMRPVLLGLDPSENPDRGNADA
jgi:hypothetical protein